SRASSGSAARAAARRAARAGSSSSSRAKKSSSTRRQRSGSMQLLAQPGAGGQEVALYGLGRDAQDLGRLLQAQAGEVAVLDDPAAARVHRREAVEREVEGEELVRLRVV